MEGLSPRQIEVCEALIKYKTNLKMSQALGIAHTGVKWHLTNIYKIMGVNSRLELFEKLLTIENMKAAQSNVVSIRRDDEPPILPEGA